ncbi:hypothetical protein JXA70_04935 [candidate division KSB1 bacterium]|nr:hypothetical protein [candidate division KSB1 bacterium]
MKILVWTMLLITTSFAQKVRLDQSYTLTGDRSKTQQYFRMQSHYIKYTQAGDRSAHEFYRLLLEAHPSADTTKYTCHRFTIDLKGKKEKSIPALQGWTYPFAPGANGLDDQGQMFSIPHSKFDNLTTDDGQTIDQEHSYAVYNCFIDFHSFDIFSTSMNEETGIEDLHKIGDFIIHAAANTEPPVNLGNSIEQGSVFRNGEITMQFKGLSRINGKLCALIGYDSGESSFTMKIRATPDMTVETSGSSHYFGDLYIDLDSFWLQKAEMAEFVVSETNIPSMEMKIPGIIERRVTIENMSKKEFELLLEKSF